MALNNAVITEVETQDGITIGTTCPFCHKKQQLVFAGEKAVKYKQGKIAYGNGMRIQDAFPFLTPDERELIMTGICDDCWNLM